MFTNSTKKNTRIFYLEPTWGNSIYAYYFGTIKEIMRIGWDVKIITKKIKSVIELKEIGLRDDDVIIFGYGWIGSDYLHEIYGIEELKNKKICFFHKLQNNYAQKVLFIKNSQIDLILSSTPKTKTIKEDTNINTVLFPYGFDHRLFGTNPNKTKRFDIGFSGALHKTNNYEKDTEFSSHNLRHRAQEKISKYFAGKKFMNGADTLWNRIKSERSYSNILQKSKIWLSTTGPMFDMSARYFQVAGSSSICLSDEIPKEYENIFIKDQNVLVFRKDCSDILDTIANALEDSKKLKAMAIFSRNDALKNHTYKKRGEQLCNLIEKIKN